MSENIDRKNIKQQNFINPVCWKEELLRFQLKDEKKSFANLKIKCTDGYFLAHKMVFSMCSQIQWEEKNSRFMDIWVVNHKLEEMAKIMLLAYTGEILLGKDWAYLDDLVKAFQFPEEKLIWGVPYKENNLFRVLAEKRIRATKYGDSAGKQPEQILIYGNGDIKPLEDLDNENGELSPYFQNLGYHCQYCASIYTDEKDFKDHERECRPMVTVKKEEISDSDSDGSVVTTAIKPPQKILVSPKEKRCSVCNHESNSVMKLVEHFHKAHKVVPGKDYSTNPIECKRCNYKRSGVSMSAFLYHVVNCKTAAKNNVTVTLDLILDSKSLDSLIVCSKKISQTPKRKPNTRGRRKVSMENVDEDQEVRQVEKNISQTVFETDIVRDTSTSSTTTTTNNNGKVLPGTSTPRSKGFILVPDIGTQYMTKSAKHNTNGSPKSDDVSQTRCVDKGIQQQGKRILIETASLKASSSKALPLHKKTGDTFTKVSNTTITMPLEHVLITRVEKQETENTKIGNQPIFPSTEKLAQFPSESEKKVPKFVIPKVISQPQSQAAQIPHSIVTHESQKNSKTYFRNSYTNVEAFGPQKTPENSEKRTPRLLSDTTSNTCKRLKFLGSTNNTPKATVANNSANESFSIITPILGSQITDNLPVAWPQTKKRKMPMNSYPTPQPYKKEKLSIKPCLESNGILKQIKFELMGTENKSTSTYKWFCSYCRSKFNSQVFYMRHGCRSRTATYSLPAKQQPLPLPRWSKFYSVKQGLPGNKNKKYWRQ